MEEELASRIVRGAVSLDKAFGELDRAIGDIRDEQERRQFAKHLGDLMGHVNDWLIRPLVRKYPQLEPDPKWDDPG